MLQRMITLRRGGIRVQHRITALRRALRNTEATPAGIYDQATSLGREELTKKYTRGRSTEAQPDKMATHRDVDGVI